MYRFPGRLRLEALESRVMLATGAEWVASGYEGVIVDTLVADEAPAIEIELKWDRILRIEGKGDGELTIDLSLLPESIDTLQIGSFTSVTFEGTTDVERLIITDIGKMDAGAISVGVGVYATGVERLRIDRTPSLAIFEGAKMLLETNGFTEGRADEQVIISKLDVLGIVTPAPLPSLILDSHNPTQTVALNHQPGRLPYSGLNSPSQLVVVQGDFERYFYPSLPGDDVETPSPGDDGEPSNGAEDPDNGETDGGGTDPLPGTDDPGTPTVVQAEAEWVAIASWLKSPTLQAAVADLVNHAQAAQSSNTADIPGSTPYSGELIPERAISSTEVELDSPTESLSSEGAEEMDKVDQLDLPIEIELLLSKDLAASLGSDSDRSTSSTATRSPLVDAPPAPLEVQSMNAEQPLARVIRLLEPLEELATRLGVAVTTFADLGASRFTSYFDTERQIPLLVEARPVRQAERNAVTIISL